MWEGGTGYKPRTDVYEPQLMRHRLRSWGDEAIDRIRMRISAMPKNVHAKKPLQFGWRDVGKIFFLRRKSPRFMIESRKHGGCDDAVIGDRGWFENL